MEFSKDLNGQFVFYFVFLILFSAVYLETFHFQVVCLKKKNTPNNEMSEEHAVRF